MTLENTAGLGVLNTYGTVKTTGKFGGVSSDDYMKIAMIDIDVPSSEGIAAAAWAVEGLDVVFPVGTVFVSADFIVETAFNTLTALTIGTYNAADGTTVQDADALIAAAGSALSAIDAVGDRLVGAGASLATGTAGNGALTTAAVLRTLYTGSAPTTGKARLVVRYYTPTP